MVKWQQIFQAYRSFSKKEILLVALPPKARRELPETPFYAQMLTIVKLKFTFPQNAKHY